MKSILSLIVLLCGVNFLGAQYPYFRSYYVRPYTRFYTRPYPFNPVPTFKGLIAPKPGDFTPEFTKHFVPDSFWSKEYLKNGNYKNP